MKKMIEKTAMILTKWMMKFIFPNLCQSFFCAKSAFVEATPYDINEISDDTNASIIKKCPICPGNKCSPSNFIIAIV